MGEIQHKLVLLGGSGVGKSNLVLRFVKDQFFENSESTIGAAFITQHVPQKDGSLVKFEIWDTAGQERYRSLAPMYYRGAHSAIVVYDVTAQESLERAKQYVKEVRLSAANAHIVLCGNKIDLVANRKIDPASVLEYCAENELVHKETSAKTGEGVREMFEELSHRQLVKPQTAPSTDAYSVQQVPKEESKCCG